MNNFYFLRYLTQELNETIKKSIYAGSLTSGKNRLDLFFEPAAPAAPEHTPVQLCLSTAPGKAALFSDRYQVPKSKNVVRFFSALEGCIVESVTQAENDRLISINLTHGHQIIFQLFGNNANAFHIHKGVIKNAFKNARRYNEKKAPQARVPAVKIYKDLEKIPEDTRRYLSGINPLLPRELLPDLIEYFELDGKTAAQLQEFNERLDHILRCEAVPACLSDGRICMLPDTFFPVPDKKFFDSFNQCARYAWYFHTHRDQFNETKSGLMRRLEKLRVKLSNRLENLSDTEKSRHRAERYEKFGHLLMANLNRMPDSGLEAVEVQDLFAGNKPVSIPLKKNLSLAENAGWYYEKSRESKKASESAVNRMAAAERELAAITTMLNEIGRTESQSGLEKWMKVRREDLEKAGIAEGGKAQARRPYRIENIRNYEVWIGKNAASNDEILKVSHKEDIWLHARGYSGSHVVIRMNRDQGYPDKAVIEKAASLAAAYSSGSGSDLMPVIYTKRKYVSRPRGALPGQVRVLRENVTMVRPESISHRS